jgi:hypothetical protein
MTVNRQNRRNEVSLIVGNLAADIAAENEREAPHVFVVDNLWWKCTEISALHTSGGLIAWHINRSVISTTIFLVGSKPLRESWENIN